MKLKVKLGPSLQRHSSSSSSSVWEPGPLGPGQACSKVLMMSITLTRKIVTFYMLKDNFLQNLIASQSALKENTVSRQLSESEIL